MRTRIGALLGVLALTVTSLVSAPAAQAEPTDRTVVNAWYRDFLGREAEDDPGSQYWVNALAYTDPVDLVWALTHSREYNARQVGIIYDRHLGRAPDLGANFWVEGATAGYFPVEWAEQNVMASQEYRDRWGSDGLTVQTWFVQLLGRAYRSDAEVDYWVWRIQQVGRLAALRELWYSDEAVTYRINNHYLYLLYRDDPSYDEVDYWRPLEVQSDLSVQVVFAASEEYRVAREYY